MHLVGFIIRIFHDARSPERKGKSRRVYVRPYLTHVVDRCTSMPDKLILRDIEILTKNLIVIYILWSRPQFGCIQERVLHVSIYTSVFRHD